MSADQGNNPARHSNGSYPAQADTGPKPPDSENAGRADRRPDVPTVEERIDGLLDRWPKRCMVPVSETHGTKLRRDAVEEPETVEETVEVGENEEITTYETVEQPALPHIAVVEELLKMYERYRDLHLKLEKRERHEEPESFLIGLENSYSPEYQSKHYARLSAWERQVLGGEYPHGEEVPGEFVEPVTVLMGLTASAYREPGDPDSGLKPICDHDRAIREAWTGSSGSVKRTLRYVLEDELGLPSEAYTWWVQSEPHGGDGANVDRSHSHPVVVLDAAAADVSADAITPETFRPVVAKHVAECDGATWDAHGVDETVEVRAGEEITSLSGYVSKYVACDPEKDLLERSDEYLMWAASQWATGTQKYSRDRVATAATKADACHQRYVSAESDQDHDHGETVVRSRKPGVSFECVECGSEHGIDQSGTLTEHRTAQAAAEPPCATDGGAGVEEPPDRDDGLTNRLLASWRDAQAAACIEEPVGGGETRSGSFRRPATWEPVSVVRTWSDEEESVGAPSGVEYAEVVVEGVGAATRKVPERCLPLPPVSWLTGPEPWKRHPVEESDVREGVLPPPEIVAKEEREHYTNSRITPKEWPADWYAQRFETEPNGDDVDGLTDAERTAVEQLVEEESVTSAVVVAGRLNLGPGATDGIERIIERRDRRKPP